jgi:hypothetical protein
MYISTDTVTIPSGNAHFATWTWADIFTGANRKRAAGHWCVAVAGTSNHIAATTLTAVTTGTYQPSTKNYPIATCDRGSPTAWLGCTAQRRPTGECYMSTVCIAPPPF